MWNVAYAAVIADGVRLHPGEITFSEAGRQRSLSDQKFIGPLNVFNARPNCISGGELQRGFQQVTVADVPIDEALIASPKKHGRPVAVVDRTVVGHGGSHAPNVFPGSERFRAVQL